jgi:ribosomal protein S18 acetylase RimI-like enzyme
MMDCEPVEPVIRGLRGPDELDELHKLDTEIFADLAYPYFVLRQLFDVHRDALLALEHDGRLVGYSLAVTGGDSVGWYLALGVEQSHRARGYGRLLAEASIRLVEVRGVAEIRLTVEPENSAAIALYESMGFTSQPHATLNYLGPGRTRMLMVRPVDVITSGTPLRDDYSGMALATRV